MVAAPENEHNIVPDYIVFGGHLRSPVEFPQLPKAEADGCPTWVISEVPEQAGLESPEFVGENRITSKSMLRLYRHAGGFRLQYDDSGTFDISADGATIDWAPGPVPDPANVREDILGPVLAMAMHLTGRLCLHGSSVVLPGGAVSFLAPKHFGKSTLALAMIAGGAKLLTDDSLPVDPVDPVMACPGVASVRFWDDTRNRFHKDGKTIVGSGGKYAATDLAAKAQLRGAQPLLAIYLLAPFLPGDDAEPVRREPLSGIQSALALVQHAKIGALLGRSQGPVMLDRATVIAGRVPVYVLRIERNLDTLDAVVGQIFAWHGAEPIRAGAASDAER